MMRAGLLAIALAIPALCLTRIGEAHVDLTVRTAGLGFKVNETAELALSRLATWNRVDFYPPVEICSASSSCAVLKDYSLVSLSERSGMPVLFEDLIINENDEVLLLRSDGEFYFNHRQPERRPKSNGLEGTIVLPHVAGRTSPGSTPFSPTEGTVVRPLSATEVAFRLGHPAGTRNVDLIDVPLDIAEVVFGWDRESDLRDGAIWADASLISAGTIVLTELDRGEMNLLPLEPLVITFSPRPDTGNLFELRLVEDAIEVRIRGSASRLLRGTERRNVMPTVIEYWKAQEPLMLYAAFASWLYAMLASFMLLLRGRANRT